MTIAINNQTVLTDENHDDIGNYVWDLCINNQLDALQKNQKLLEQLEPNDYVREAMIYGHDDVVLYWYSLEAHQDYMAQLSGHIFYTIVFQERLRDFQSQLVQKVLSLSDHFEDSIFIEISHGIEVGNYDFVCDELEDWFYTEVERRGLNDD